jgi:hypothetical protein
MKELTQYQKLEYIRNEIVTILREDPLFPDPNGIKRAALNCLVSAIDNIKNIRLSLQPKHHPLSFEIDLAEKEIISTYEEFTGQNINELID